MQNYSNVAVETTLSVGINASTTTITVGATTGFPSPNFTLVIDQGTASEELVLVTAVGGTTLTVTRGYDGTTGTAHSTGATVRHAHSAKDFADSRTHEAATSGVHGVTGSLVGTTDTQTLTGKTISADSNTLSGIAASSFVLSNASGNIDGAAAAKAIPAGAVVGTTDTQTLTNKTVVHPTTGKNLGSGCYGLRQLTAAQSLTSGTWTAIAFPAGSNVGGVSAPGGVNTRIAVPVAGLYLITGVVSFAANVTGARDVGLLKNSGGVFGGSAIIGLGGVMTETSGGNTDVNVPTLAILAANDYVELWANQSSGGALNADTRTRLAVTLISATT